MENTLSLSQLITPVSTYMGNLDFSAFDGDVIQDLIDNRGLAENSDCDSINYSIVMGNFKKELTKLFKSEIMGNKDVMTAFEKYGITINNISFWSPREYNFQTDSIDIEYTFDANRRDELRTEIEFYIDNVRRKSCDGYMSVEPDLFEDVTPTDYAFIYAIIEKEGIRDDLVSIFERCIDEAQIIYEDALTEHLFPF